MKKLITSIVLSTALVGGACMATGCAPTNSGSTGNDEAASVQEINSAAEFYTYGAASIGSIISATESAEAVSETPTEGEESTTETPETPADPEAPAESEQPSGELTEEQLATVNSYMGLVENLLANGGLSYIRTESDREGYEVREEISFSDLEGNVITYVMYYNSTLDYTETESDDDEEETESMYTIEGVMVIDGVDYALEGYSEVETSADESESETYFKVTLADGSYIVMEQEAENDETELVYKVVEDKKVVEKIKFEYETEHGETELKMTVEKDGVKTSLKFLEEIEGDKKIIKVTSNDGTSKTAFEITVTQDADGNNVYQYAFGDKIKEMHRPHFEKGGLNGDWDDDDWHHGGWNRR